MEKIRKAAKKQAGVQPDLAILMGAVVAVQRSVCTQYKGAACHERVWRMVEDALCSAADIDRSLDFRRTAILGQLSNSASLWLERTRQ